MKLGTVTLSDGTNRLVAPAHEAAAPEDGPYIDLHAAGVAAGLSASALHALHSTEAMLAAGDGGVASVRAAVDYAQHHGVGDWTIDEIGRAHV